MKKVFTVVLVFGFCAALLAQAPAPTKFEVTQVQQLQLQNAYKDAELAQVVATEANNKLQASIAAFNALIAQAKIDQKFPEDIQYSVDQSTGTVTFSEPPKKPEAPKPAPSKP